MKRPSRFYLEWDEGDEERGPILRSEDVDGFADAIKARALALSRRHGCTILWNERIGIHDVTPSEDPPGLIWDHDDERLVLEITAPELLEEEASA